MRRRDFVTLLGGAVATLPLAARAQQPGKRPTIGFLGPTTPSAMSRWVDAFVQRLRELGWIEGRTIAIEVRWAEGHSERAFQYPVHRHFAVPEFERRCSPTAVASRL